MSPMEATVDPPSRGSRLDADHPENGVLIPCRFTGKLELRVPQDRAGRFSTELFERYQRSERALVAALAEMYVRTSTPGGVGGATSRDVPYPD